MRSVLCSIGAVSVPEIGEKVCRSVYARDREARREVFRGVVTYIHPEYRYYTVTFGAPPYTFRESYLIGREEPCQ